MKFGLNTNLVKLFSGTYETIWDVDVEGLAPDDGCAYYAEFDFNEFLTSIADAYKDNQDYVLNLIQAEAPFVKSLKFTGKYTKPAYYNYSTDRLFFDVEIDKDLLNKTLEQLKTDDDFDKYLKHNFTSRDGFMSFTPNNYEDIVNEIETNGNEAEQALSAIITYLLDDKLWEIERDVWNDWSGNGYYGLDYEIVKD